MKIIKALAALKIRKFKKKELILLLILFIMLFGSLTLSALRGMYLGFMNLEKEISRNEEKLLRLRSIVKQAKELDSEYERLISGHQQLKDSDSLLQEIETIANKLNINILNIKPTIAQEESLYRVYSITIESQDDVSSLAEFWHVVTEKLKNVSLERIEINARDKAETPRITFLINAAVFKE